MLKEILKGQMEFANFLTKLGIQDLTDDQLRIRPAGIGNPGIWIAGHIAFSRSGYRYHSTGKEQRVPASWKELFARGAKVDQDLSIYPPIAEIVDFLESEYQAVTDFLDSLSEDDLKQPLKVQVFKLVNIAELFSALASHETFHAGQFSLIRKLAGKGTIR